jgi:hypothetical protein
MIRGLIDLLIADATIISSIGTNNGVAKVYPVVAEQEARRPYVTLRRVSQGSAIVKGQASEVDQPIINIAAYADTYQTCIEIQEAIRAVLDDFEGSAGNYTYKRIWYQNSNDLYDQEDRTFVVVDTYAARAQRVVT